MDGFLRIKILNKDEYNPRKDRKHHHWFRVDNLIPFARKLNKLDADQCWFFICLLAFANEDKDDTVAYDIDYLEKHTRCSKRKIEAAVKILTENGTIELVGKTGNQSVSTGANNSCDVPDRCPTDGRTDGQYEQYEQDGHNRFGPRELAELWNEKVKDLKSFPKVDLARFKATQERYVSAKARLSEEGSREYWISVIDKIVASSFCQGINDRGWVADFEFLVRPETHIKTLERKYDDRERPPSSGASQRSVLNQPKPINFGSPERTQQMLAEQEASRGPRTLTPEQIKEMAKSKIKGVS